MLCRTFDIVVVALNLKPHDFSRAAEERPVVFLQHGLLCSSADWVVATPTKGLGTVSILTFVLFARRVVSIYCPKQPQLKDWEQFH